jgi:hypothetical protein
MRPLICAAILVLGGCVARGPACGVPPGGDFGTLNRVCGVPAWHAPPLRAEGGNLWPAAPTHVPTMLEVQHQPGPPAWEETGVRAAPHRPRDTNLCRATARPAASVARGLCYADRP